MKSFVRPESALVYLNSNFPVSVAEGFSLEGPAVDLFDREDIIVQGLIQDTLPDLDVPEHIVGHSEAAVGQLQGGEEDVLEELEIAVVTVLEIAAEHGNGVFRRHDPDALPAHDFPYVRILLVGHDAGTRSQFVRETDEAEVGAHVEAAVCGETVEGQRNGPNGGGDGLLGLTP